MTCGYAGTCPSKRGATVMNLTLNTDIEASWKQKKPSLGIGTIPWHTELRIVTQNLTPNPDYYNPVKSFDIS